MELIYLRFLLELALLLLLVDEFLKHFGDGIVIKIVDVSLLILIDDFPLLIGVE